MRTLTVRIPEAVDDALSRICRETVRTKSFFVRQALEGFLQEKVFYQKALDRLNDNTDKIVSAEEMEKAIL